MKILIAYDGSSFADAAIADLRNAGLPEESEFLVVTVAHREWPNDEATRCADAGGALVKREFPLSKVSSEALWGDPANIIKKTVGHWQPDLLVVGSHGRSAAGRFLLGSVSLDLVHHATCSVRVVRADAARPERRLHVLVASDGSPQSEATLDAVATRNWPEGTQARVISVAQTLVPPIPVLVPALEGNTYATEAAYQVIEAADDRLRTRLHNVAEAAAMRLQKTGLETSAIVLDSNPGSEIVAEAVRWHADTVFVGARGLGTLDRFLLGSVSTAVVTHAHCSVEVVR